MPDDVIAPRLMPGEAVVWSGRPAGGLFPRLADVSATRFTRIWLVVAGGTMVGMAGLYGRSMLSAFLPGFCIGLATPIGFFLVDLWLRASTRYALTDRRILIERTGPFPRRSAIGLVALPEARSQTLSGGRGTIRFGAAPGKSDRGIWLLLAFETTPAFLDVPDAAALCELIRRTTGRQRAG